MGWEYSGFVLEGEEASYDRISNRIIFLSSNNPTKKDSNTPNQEDRDFFFCLYMRFIIAKEKPDETRYS